MACKYFNYNEYNGNPRCEYNPKSDICEYFYNGNKCPNYVEAKSKFKILIEDIGNIPLPNTTLLDVLNPEFINYIARMLYKMGYRKEGK